MLRHDPEANGSCLSAFKPLAREDWVFAYPTHLRRAIALCSLTPRQRSTSWNRSGTAHAWCTCGRAPVPAAEGPRRSVIPRTTLLSRVAEAGIPGRIPLGDSDI